MSYTPRKTKNRRITDEQRDLVTKHLGSIGPILGRRHSSLDREDAIQEGVIGMMNAAQSFRPDRGFKFATYAQKKVRGAVLDAERKGTESVIKFGRYAANQHWDAHDRSCAVASISQGDTGQTVPEHTIEQYREDSPLHQADRHDWHERFYAAVACLTEQEQVMIRGRVDGLSMETIGLQVGVSESRISQLLVPLLDKLAAIMVSPGEADVICRDADRGKRPYRRKGAMAIAS